ncbi:MAG: hypothetical protein ACOC2N_05500 [Spirochaetota bacterium]
MRRTLDKIYCVYIARDEGIIQEHARRLDVRASRTSRVATVINPSTGG